jgi:hypothetical protein
VPYVVGFHEYPDGLEVGGTYECGVVTDAYMESPASSIHVNVWDPDDFERRTQGNPNHRYVEGGPFGECPENPCEPSAPPQQGP